VHRPWAEMGGHHIACAWVYCEAQNGYSLFNKCGRASGCEIVIANKKFRCETNIDI
jgi:hypothetical protein